MGARGNVVILNGGKETCLYTHSGATMLPRALARALDAGADTAERIRDEIGEDLGDDIRIAEGKMIPDFDELHVDVVRRTVAQVTFDITATKETLIMEPRVVERWSFEAFIEHGEGMELPGPVFIVGIMNAIDAANEKEA